MKIFSFIFMAYIFSTACRSSYDEGRHKPEVKTPDKVSSTISPVVETPSTSPRPNTGNPASPGTSVTNPNPNSSLPTPNPSESSNANPGGSTNASQNVSIPNPADPSSLAMAHDASAEELKKYNCKGTAVITDSGRDANGDGVLQDAEIRETRIDCTEVVPGTPAKP